MNESLALGIDLGGTNTSFGIVNAKGEILAKGKMPTTGHGPVEAYISSLKEKIEHLFDLVGKDKIIGAGIGAPNGNYYTGEIVFAPNLPWQGVIPLAKLVSEALGIKTIVT